MILEILDQKVIKVDGEVEVTYVNGRIETYNSEEIKHLVLSPGLIMAVVVKGK